MEKEKNKKKASTTFDKKQMSALNKIYQEFVLDIKPKDKNK
jgi:hypothetical protein